MLVLLYSKQAPWVRARLFFVKNATYCFMWSQHRWSNCRHACRSWTEKSDCVVCGIARALNLLMWYKMLHHKVPVREVIHAPKWHKEWIRCCNNASWLVVPLRDFGRFLFLRRVDIVLQDVVMTVALSYCTYNLECMRVSPCPRVLWIMFRSFVWVHSLQELEVLRFRMCNVCWYRTVQVVRCAHADALKVRFLLKP